MGHDVFVSYSKENRLTADAVCARLEQNGVRCWIAPRDVTPGEPWGAAIVQAIGEARVMVLVLSHAANTSRQIWHEVERAVDKGVTLIPLRIEDVVPSANLEYYISATHWLDALTEPIEAHLDHLLGVVNRILERPDEPRTSATRRPAPAPAQAARRPRAWLPWLTIALLAVAGIVYAVTRDSETPAPAPGPTASRGGTPEGPIPEVPAPDERAEGTWWLERAGRDRSVFYEDEFASLLWVFTWARACDGERARAEIDDVIQKLVGSDAGHIPPGERSDLYILLGLAFARGGCADETEAVLAEVTKPLDRTLLWLEVARLRNRAGDTAGLERCRTALEHEVENSATKVDEAVARSALGRALRRLGQEDECARQLRKALELLRAGAADTPNQYELTRAVGALASALVEVGGGEAGAPLVAEFATLYGTSEKPLYPYISMAGAANGGLEFTLRMLERSDDLKTCSFLDYADLVLMGGFHDDPIPSPALPFVIGELLRVGRSSHAAQVIERIEIDAARLPALCETAIATARQDSPAAGRPWVDEAEALLDAVERGAQRDLARAILVRARVLTGDPEGARRLARSLVEVPEQVAQSSRDEMHARLLAALALTRASLGAWDALEEDLKDLPGPSDRALLQVMVADVLLRGDYLVTP